MRKQCQTNTLFPNLLAELARVNMSKSELAKEAGISSSSIYYKFNGEVDWTFKEMDVIKLILEEHTGNDLTLDYLFKKKTQEDITNG